MLMRQLSEGQLKYALALQTVLGIILGGGAGSRLYPLTKKRAKPAVPLGANYRLIDIPVSNCINSSISKIYCLTQFNSASLNRHLSQAYVSPLLVTFRLLTVLSIVQHMQIKLCAFCVVTSLSATVQPGQRLQHAPIRSTSSSCSEHLSHHFGLILYLTRHTYLKQRPQCKILAAALHMTQSMPGDAELQCWRLQLKGFCRGAGSQPEPHWFPLVPGHSRCRQAVLVAV